MCDTSDILPSSVLFWTLSLVPAKNISLPRSGIGRGRDSVPADQARGVRLHSCLLETRNIPGWKNYLRVMVTISRALAMLEREVRDVQTSLLVLIEAAHQCKLTEDICEGQEIGDGAVHPQYSVRARVHGQLTAPDHEVRF
ncbi:hypothetical protein B0H14DRAFT_2607994 [Mycena olivaceomarginata]|nr:hypothetical protein B0H14DRAFT_2607994 [Mycena olivaceomarginata]